ncbi:Zn-dependent protease [Methanofollis sp. W23]|uniref:peptidase M50 n=1 Tax=Methanofollis sp. W23 TaxID=2817849 RepID=UPI001AE55E8C|nr:peptidase M50 [Methanofollis sp. W23]MBP2147019.1 Zn-dependent protease [Methanofollis sp. W23]
MLERIPRRERRDLLVAWAAIAVAFTFLYLRDSVDLVWLLIIFVFSLLTVGIGFVFHELAHKFAAMHFGYWAEFRKDNIMLLMAVLLAALVGVVFAAPGATMVYGATTRRENGVISAAGPATNLVLCAIFAGIYFVGASLSPWVMILGMMGVQINAMLAAFNMLPVSVLDGKKVLDWDKGIFAVLFVASFGAVIAALTFL